jgi:hypothetical protein
MRFLMRFLVRWPGHSDNPHHEKWAPRAHLERARNVQ